MAPGLYPHCAAVPPVVLPHEGGMPCVHLRRAPTQVRTTSAGSSRPWREADQVGAAGPPGARRRRAIRYCMVRGVRMSLANFGEAALTRNRRLKSSLSRSMSLASPTAPASRSSADSGTTWTRPGSPGIGTTHDRPAVRRGGPVALRVGRVRLVGVVERRERPARLGAAEHVAGPRLSPRPNGVARPAVDAARVLGDVRSSRGSARTASAGRGASAPAGSRTTSTATTAEAEQRRQQGRGGRPSSVQPEVRELVGRAVGQALGLDLPAPRRARR